MLFLEAYNKRGRTDEVDIILGGISITDNLGTMDPAAIEDWMEAVDKSKEWYKLIDKETVIKK